MVFKIPENFIRTITEYNIKKFKKPDDGVFIFKVFLEFLSYMRFDRSGYLLTGKKKGEMGSVLSAMDFGQNIYKRFNQ